jgi:multicomponent K+:H+ antiporter subunit A
VAVVARAVTGGAVMDYHLALWHGFTPALGLSAIAVAVGLGALVAYRRVRALWQAGPHPEAKAMFDAFIEGAAALARGITHGLHNGSLQRYLAFALTAFTLAGFAAFLAAPHAAGTRALLPAHPAAIAAWVLLVGGCALTVMLFRRRVLSVLVVGTVGLIVCLAFIYLSAPDLALTQISVEVATVILILLALYFLPKEGPAELLGARRSAAPPARRRARHRGRHRHGRGELGDAHPRRQLAVALLPRQTRSRAAAAPTWST